MTIYHESYEEYCMSKDIDPDPLKVLEDAIGSVRKPADVDSHEILDMHKVFAVIDECYQLREKLNSLGSVDGDD